MSADQTASEPKSAYDESTHRAPDASPHARFEQLFREHNDALVYFVNAILNSWQESKEVVQEAYVRLLGLGQSKEINHTCAYLYRTASNLAKDRLRKREVRARHEHLVLFDATQRDELTPERWWIAEQERACMERAVAELPPKCRMAFTLVELQEQAVLTVAEHMGIKANAVRELIRRAYAHLAKALASAENRSEQ